MLDQEAGELGKSLRGMELGLDGLSGFLGDGRFDFGFWIADFGFPGNKRFFEESEFSNVRCRMFVFLFDVGRWMFDVGRSSSLTALLILR